MGCAFCASTLKGLKRNLTAGEMMAQAVFINEFLRRQPGSEKNAACLLDNMVIMGSGEPLLNYREVLKFLRLIHSPEAFNFGYRRITVSTSGIVPQIYALADENIPVTLSISLHAPNDELRSRLMPVNRKYPIDELLRAGRAYGEKTGRRVTYEYVLIGGVNDGSEEARELADLIKGDLAAVNLIPLNPVSERDFKKPTHKRVCAFADVLAAQNIAVTVRKEMGSDIAAACGQLVSRFEAARQNSK